MLQGLISSSQSITAILQTLWMTFKKMKATHTTNWKIQSTIILFSNSRRAFHVSCKCEQNIILYSEFRTGYSDCISILKFHIYLFCFLPVRATCPAYLNNNKWLFNSHPAFPAHHIVWFSENSAFIHFFSPRHLAHKHA